MRLACRKPLAAHAHRAIHDPHRRYCGFGYLEVTTHIRSRESTAESHRSPFAHGDVSAGAHQPRTAGHDPGSLLLPHVHVPICLPGRKNAGFPASASPFPSAPHAAHQAAAGRAAARSNLDGRTRPASPGQWPWRSAVSRISARSSSAGCSRIAACPSGRSAPLCSNAAAALTAR